MWSQERGHLTYNTLLNRAAASGFCQTRRFSDHTPKRSFPCRRVAQTSQFDVCDKPVFPVFNSELVVRRGFWLSKVSLTQRLARIAR